MERYTYGVSILFWLVSTVLMAWLLNRASRADVLDD